MLIMELPPYKRPVLKLCSRHMWDRSKLFLRRAGTVNPGHQHPALVSWRLIREAAPVQQQFAAKRAAIEASTPTDLTDAEAGADCPRRNAFRIRQGGGG